MEGFSLGNIRTTPLRNVSVVTYMERNVRVDDFFNGNQCNCDIFIRWRYKTSHLTVNTHTVVTSFEQVILLLL